MSRATQRRMRHLVGFDIPTSLIRSEYPETPDIRPVGAGQLHYAWCIIFTDQTILPFATESEFHNFLTANPHILDQRQAATA